LRDDFAFIIYNDHPDKHDMRSCGETVMPQASQPAEKIKVMGDKSPKSNQKKSSQKQVKVNSDDQKKQQAVAAKQAATKKK
jgi:hypothetical protein